ncbi:hypothetical protein ACOXXX_01195 [Thalassococcus sp. BH17M4-6]
MRQYTDISAGQSRSARLQRLFELHRQAATQRDAGASNPLLLEDVERLFKARATASLRPRHGRGHRQRIMAG